MSCDNQSYPFSECGSVASNVMLMHHWTVRYSIYGVVQEKSVSYGLESTVYGIRMRWEGGNERYV
jgi:hypothetical protein